MLKLYSCSAASMMVLMVPLPDCTPPLILSLSISVSHASTGWLVITLMDEQTRREVVSLSLELVEVQCPTTPTWSPPIASSLWHIISPVICGQIEVEGDKEIFCPHENRWMLQLCRLSRGLFFSPHDEPSCFIKDWFHAPLWTLDDWLLQHIFRNLDLPLFCSFLGGMAYNWLFFQESVIYYFVKYWSSGKRISHWSPLCCFHARSKLRVCLWSKMVVMPWNDVWCNKHATGKVW